MDSALCGIESLRSDLRTNSFHVSTNEKKISRPYTVGLPWLNFWSKQTGCISNTRILPTPYQEYNVSGYLFSPPPPNLARPWDQFNLFADYDHTLPLGDTLRWSCPSGFVLSHDFYARPDVRVPCQADGVAQPEEWPLCVDRKCCILLGKIG